MGLKARRSLEKIGSGLLRSQASTTDAKEGKPVVQSLSQQYMSLQEFLTWLPETGRYELHDGVVVEMQPTGARVRAASLEEK